MVRNYLNADQRTASNPTEAYSGRWNDDSKDLNK